MIFYLAFKLKKKITVQQAWFLHLMSLNKFHEVTSNCPHKCLFKSNCISMT